VLSLDALVEKAEKRSVRLQELRARAEATRLAVDAASPLPNPELRLAPMNLNEFADGNVGLRPMLRMTFPRPFESAASTSAARAADAEARSAVLAEQQALEAEVRWAFDDVALLDAELETLARVAETRRTLATRVAEGVELSVATAVERSLAELSSVDAAQNLADLGQRRSEAASHLLDLAGLDAATPLVLESTQSGTRTLLELPNERALVEEALRHDPRIAAIGARIDAASAKLGFERSKQWPWFGLVGLGYQLGPAVKPGFMMQVGVELPIFDSNRAAVTASDATLTAETLSLASEVERVGLQVRELLRRARSAEALVMQFRAQVEQATGRASAASNAAIAAQGLDVVRALELQERQALVELRVLRLTRNYRVAVAELRRALGGRLPKATKAAPPAPP